MRTRVVAWFDMINGFIVGTSMMNRYCKTACYYYAHLTDNKWILIECQMLDFGWKFRRSYLIREYASTNTYNFCKKTNTVFTDLLTFLFYWYISIVTSCKNILTLVVWKDLYMSYSGYRSFHSIYYNFFFQ